MKVRTIDRWGLLHVAHPLVVHVDDVVGGLVCRTYRELRNHLTKEQARHIVVNLLIAGHASSFSLGTDKVGQR